MSDLEKLLDIADSLDRQGMSSEADDLSEHISKIARKGYHKNGLAEKTVEGHQELLEGYRAALKAHSSAYKKALLSGNEKDSPNYGVLRETAKGFSYNSNSIFLHEMYIEDVYEGKPYAIEKATKLYDEIKSRYVGSRNKLMGDMMRLAKLPRSGWVLLSFCTQSGEISVEIVDLHDEGFRACTVPIACIDMWEHAYVNDFGNDREAYFEWWAGRMNWRNVEKRLKRLIRIK